MTISRRNFLTLSLIASGTLLLSPKELLAKVESFKSIPAEKEIAFLELRKEIAARPYNSDLINTLLDFNERIGTSAFKDPSMAFLLKFTYLNSRAPETKERLREAIENPMIQSQEDIEAIRKAQEEGLSTRDKLIDKKKALDTYRQKQFAGNFENLLYYRMTFQTEKEKMLRSELESNEKRFYPQSNQEMYFKIKYYIALGNITEAEYSFEQIEKNIYKKVNEVAGNEKRKLDQKKKMDPRKKEFKKDNKDIMIDVDLMIMAYIAGLGSFLFRDSNPDKSKEMGDISKSLMGEDYSNFYYYQLHELYAIYEDYNNSISNLEYIKNKDNYKELDIERFFLYNLGAQKDVERKEWRTAWINAKEGVILGLSLNYEKYYKLVINLKKILKEASTNYINQLVQTRNKDLAQSVIDETNRVMSLTKKK